MLVLVVVFLFMFVVVFLFMLMMVVFIVVTIIVAMMFIMMVIILLMAGFNFFVQVILNFSYIEGIHPHYLCHVYFCLFSALNRTHIVDRFYPVFHSIKVLRFDQINFIEQQFVGKSNLLNGLIGGSILNLFVQMMLNIKRIHHRHNPIQQLAFGHVLVKPEGGHDRRWVSQTSGLYDDTV